MATSTKTVILNQPSDWDPWIFVVKSIADGGDTWKYIDPSLEEEPVIPRRPAPPTAQDVNQAVSSVAALQPAELEVYKVLLAEYREQLATVKQVLDTIQTARTHIVTTVSASNIVYIKKSKTVYQMLKALKKRLAPTDEARILQVEQKYQKLKRYNKRGETQDGERSCLCGGKHGDRSR
jgi:hypothetical protein